MVKNMYKRMLVMSIVASLACELRGMNEEKEEKKQNQDVSSLETLLEPLLVLELGYWKTKLYEKDNEFSIYNVMGEIPTSIGENSKLQKVNFFETDVVERYGGYLENGLYIEAFRYKREAERRRGVLYHPHKNDSEVILSESSAQSYFNCFKKLYEERH